MEDLTILEAQDGIETQILLALHARGFRAPVTGDGRGLETFCPPGSIFPKHSYTFDARSGADDRIYTADLSQIVVDPERAIGSRLETMILCDDGMLKWGCIVPMPAPRGGVLRAATNRRASWFCIHHRKIGSDGRQIDYVKRPLALVDGDVVPLLYKDWGVNNFKPAADREEMRVQLALALSVHEDCLREGAYLATVEEGVRLSFPVSAAAYKDFFALRDGPHSTPTGRKNPILHWCRKHMRKVDADPAPVEVQRHTRGTETLTIGPMTLTIQPTDGMLKGLI